MMREIKFRAWDGNSMFNVDVLALTPCTWGCLDYGKRGVSLSYQPSIKVMQFTGMKDINDVEIYEGDILKFEDSIVGHIVWGDNCFNLNGEGCITNFDAERELEVVGNIYQIAQAKYEGYTMTDKRIVSKRKLEAEFRTVSQCKTADYCEGFNDAIKEILTQGVNSEPVALLLEYIKQQYPQFKSEPLYTTPQPAPDTVPREEYDKLLEALKFYANLDWKENTQAWQLPALQAIAEAEGK